MNQKTKPKTFLFNMKIGEKGDKNKEYCHLFYEYLKRSENYRDFCNWIRDQIGIKLPVPRKSKNDAERKVFDQIWGACLRWQKTAAIPEDERNGNHPFTALYLTFFDVHARTFEKWWEKYQEENIKNTADLIKKMSVQVYDRNSLKHNINWCISSFIMSKKREPTIYEFRDYFLAYMTEFPGPMTSGPGGEFLIRVNADYNMTILKERFQVLLKEHNKRDREDKIQEKLWAYLDVYDLKQQQKPKLKWVEIRDKVDQKRKLSIKTDDREAGNVKKYFPKAKQIIKNAEKGIFPGKF